MVNDHRTGLKDGNIQGVLDGDLDPFISAYLLGAAAGTLGEGSDDGDSRVAVQRCDRAGAPNVACYTGAAPPGRAGNIVPRVGDRHAAGCRRRSGATRHGASAASMPC